MADELPVLSLDPCWVTTSSPSRGDQAPPRYRPAAEESPELALLTTSRRPRSLGRASPWAASPPCHCPPVSATMCRPAVRLKSCVRTIWTKSPDASTGVMPGVLGPRLDQALTTLVASSTIMSAPNPTRYQMNPVNLFDETNFNSQAMET